MVFRALTLTIVLAVAWTETGPVTAEERLAPKPLAVSTLRDFISERLNAHGQDVQAAVWVGAADGPAWFKQDAATVMPTASAIKTFYLVEFFAAYGDRLDSSLPETNDILGNDHPAVSHFPPAVRGEIRRELGSASVRRIGEVMMGQTDVSNAVYNAAANLITARLGGPQKLTSLIHDRDPRFKTVMVRRYMLRDRTQPGDNEATTEAFAALYQALASRTLNGISELVMTALHEVLQRGSNSSGVLYEKDGGLSTDPLTSVKAGWRQTGPGPVVFVVMCRQPTVETARRTAVYDDLRALSLAIRDRAVKITGD